MSYTGLDSADFFQNVRTLAEAKYLLNILLTTTTTTVHTTSFSKSKEKDFYSGVEKENMSQTQIMHLSNSKKINTLTSGDMKIEEKEKEKGNEKQKEKEKVRMTSRGIVLSALKGHDNLFSSPPTPSISLSSSSSSSSSSTLSSSAPAPPSLSFSLSVPVPMTAKDAIMQQRLNAFNKSIMITHKHIDEQSVKTNNTTSIVKTVLKSKSSSSSSSSSLIKSRNIPTPIKQISEKRNVFQIKNVTPKKNLKMKNSLKTLNSVTNGNENKLLNGKIQVRVSGSNNTDINRKTTVAHVAASLAKMKENMSQCMPVNLSITSQHNTQTNNSIIERNKKVEKNTSSSTNKKENHIETKEMNNIQVRKFRKVNYFIFFCFPILFGIYHIILSTLYCN